MRKVINGIRVPIKMWLDEIDANCLEQAMNLSALPFVFKHIALMPDAHTGMGMPIGGVMATCGVVVPNAVGVDIGCGMCAMKTSLKAADLSKETLETIVAKIKRFIPLGFEHRIKPVDEVHLPQNHDISQLPVVKSQSKSLLLQLGTLGGGNHFIEIQRSTLDDVWIMIHSGSRNLGLKVAEHYNKQAEKLNKQWYSESLPQLAFLPIEDGVAKKYMEEMAFCVDFAFANRRLMMEQIKYELSYMFRGIEYEPLINIAHNYAAWENHFGSNVIVHRKGATRAYNSDVGIIPGSQGTKSFIVLGLGNAESFMSCSHGAGRLMGRKDAQRRLNLEAEIARMDAQGIVHGIKSVAELDEAAGAYKDIDVVMENQADLVKVLVELHPLAVVKG